MPKPIIIDTDPGIDDVVAITAALRSDELDVKLITTVGGNVGIENTTRNAVDLVTFLGKDTPIAKGLGEPLVLPAKTASQVHGNSGIGDYRFEAEANPDLLSNDNAIMEMKNYIMKSADPVTLVPIGPLTNIALLLKMFPETKENIEQIILMGGAVEGGNATPAAEFNIYADPHAAKIVFDSSMKIVMCGLDATRLTSVSFDDIAKLREQGNVGEMIYQMLDHYKQAYSEKAIVIHDLCTIFYLTNPELFQVKRANINVVTEGDEAGNTIADFSDEGNVLVCVDADVEAFRRKFAALLD
ncbi:nucleoside hydrolase [Lentibacillus sp. Marseille-P4043]|uniref:nucleoside hydrolase n=1 Tax=Lentibacillus sp. Marseille-P4043 TaxID=2040293 RepID=UPI000D0AF4B4|nr:nucleoside hydrolase [Lentibacillus sp. Marseille-P4043]